MNSGEDLTMGLFYLFGGVMSDSKMSILRIGL